MAVSKLGFKEIVEHNEDIIKKMEEMWQLTKNLETKADGFQKTLQDAIMPQIILLLQDLQEIIKDTKVKTHKYADSKIEGANLLNEIENVESGKIKRG